MWWWDKAPLKEMGTKESKEYIYRLCIVGDLNGWTGDRTRARITGALGVPGENCNESGGFCAERELCVGNTYFKHRCLHKYTRVVRDQDGMEINSMVDLVLVKRDMLRYVQDVRAVRWMGRGLSDHHIVLCKVRLEGAWIKRRKVLVGARRIRSEKLRENQYRERLLLLLLLLLC